MKIMKALEDVSLSNLNIVMSHAFSWHSNLCIHILEISGKKSQMTTFISHLLGKRIDASAIKQQLLIKYIMRKLNIRM